MSVVRILLVEDHQVVREGLQSLLAADAALQVVAEARNGAEAITLVQLHKPDVVVMDIEMPGLSGVDAASRIKRRTPSVVVVMLSMYNDRPTVEKALKAGALGYVLKGDGIMTVKAAIFKAAQGETYLSPSVSERVHDDEPNRSPAILTAREREILAFVARGHTGRQIAEILHISPKTVENHRGRMMGKLGIHSTAKLVRYALKVGVGD
ncbi:MAG: response regulator transcription factor [Myxococcota bacterium]